jgi:hypothetical protein
LTVTLADQYDDQKQRGARSPRPDAVTKIVNDYDADGHLIGCHEEELRFVDRRDDGPVATGDRAAA